MTWNREYISSHRKILFSSQKDFGLMYDYDSTPYLSFLFPLFFFFPPLKVPFWNSKSFGRKLLLFHVENFNQIPSHFLLLEIFMLDFSLFLFAMLPTKWRHLLHHAYLLISLSRAIVITKMSFSTKPKTIHSLICVSSLIVGNFV